MMADRLVLKSRRACRVRVASRESHLKRIQNSSLPAEHVTSDVIFVSSRRHLDSSSRPSLDACLRASSDPCRPGDFAPPPSNDLCGLWDGGAEKIETRVSHGA
jgi:hypothetical protein